MSEACKKKSSIQHHIDRKVDGCHIDISLDGRLIYQMIRENNRGGLWCLYSVADGVHDEKIDRDRYSNDIIERIKCGYYQ